MRASAVALAVLVGAPLAGCLGGPDGAAPTPAPAPPPYSTFVCADGALIAAATAGPARCNVRVTGNAPGRNGPANELAIAVDPRDANRLVAGAKDYTLGPDAECGQTRVWAGVYWSADGGRTWGNDLLPGHDQTAAQQPTHPLAGYRCTTDPVVAWDGRGRAYFSGLSYAQRRLGAAGTTVGDVGSNVWIARSDDGGRTWPFLRVVAQGDGLTVFHDKQWFAVDARTGALYMTWSLFVFLPNGDARDQIVFSRSTDAGASWTAPRVLYETARPGGVAAPAPELDKQFSTPAVDRDGRLFVTWIAGPRIWITRSDDGGERWTDARVAVDGIRTLPSPLPPTGFRASTYPVLAVDRSDGPGAGALHLVWAAYDDATKADVWTSRSTDGGDSWSAPARVNDDAGTATDQFMPWVDVGPRGDVHVVYYDRRADPGNRRLDVAYAHSADGVAFDASVRLNEVPIDGNLSRHQSGAEFIGDYIGVAEGGDGRVHALWVDTRHGRADAYTTALLR